MVLWFDVVVGGGEHNTDLLQHFDQDVLLGGGGAVITGLQAQGFWEWKKLV